MGDSIEYYRKRMTLPFYSRFVTVILSEVQGEYPKFTYGEFQPILPAILWFAVVASPAAAPRAAPVAAGAVVAVAAAVAV